LTSSFKLKMFTTLIFEKIGAKAYITLNRPEVFNALNITLLEELNEAFKLCHTDVEIRVVVLSGGKNKAFCAGADLKSGLNDINLGNTLKATYNPLILGMRNLPKPIICKLNGVSAGAGMSIALACDIIIADENAYLSELFVGIGLMPDAGSMFFLPRIVGSQVAFELCSTGRKVYMEEAVKLKIVNKAVKTEDLDTETEQLADFYALSATKSIGQMKMVLNKTFENTLEEVLNMEAEAQTKCGHSADFAEGVMSFLMKKKPNFIGK
jgi:2-(1,2-epoxy-1,2-dihydrophenyl)acetyl-CoA isomerase